jgi:hypothetical protein
MNITLYAICKNEEKNVDRFIETSRLFSDTVVVDTGSTDNTVERLRNAGITVHEHPMSREEFDFSEARNKSLSYVKTDWALSLDFNEDIQEFSPEGFTPLEDQFTSFKHKRFDKIGDEEKESKEVHIRFHRTQNYTWKNAVHEHPIFIPSKDFENEVFVETTVKIIKDINKTVDKELFYLSLCEREHKKDPTNWYFIWFIFKHYNSVENYELALDYGSKFLSNSKPYSNTFRPIIFQDCSKLFYQIGQFQNSVNYAIHSLSESIQMGSEYVEQSFLHILHLGIYLQNSDLVVFASSFSPETKALAERTQAIDKLFLTNLDDLHSCWRGHRGFAEWLVKTVKPKITVDLGVDHGFSSFAFAIPRIGHVYGIDSFEGDQYAGERDPSLYPFVLSKQEKLFLKDNLTFIKGYFDDIAKEWDKEIDILHIDGDHAYESIKNDYETWSKFLSDDAVILFHDTMVDNINGNEYGVKRFFEELDLPKLNFTHTFGLGVASKNKDLINLIKENIPLDRPV